MLLLLTFDENRLLFLEIYVVEICLYIDLTFNFQCHWYALFLNMPNIKSNIHVLTSACLRRTKYVHSSACKHIAY